MKVAIQTIDPFPDVKTIATVWVDESGAVCCDQPELLEQWAKDGILGRVGQGRLFPKDGAAFVEELPHAFRGVSFMAVVQP